MKLKMPKNHKLGLNSGLRGGALGFSADQVTTAYSRSHHIGYWVADGCCVEDGELG